MPSILLISYHFIIILSGLPFIVQLGQDLWFTYIITIWSCRD